MSPQSRTRAIRPVRRDLPTLFATRDALTTVMHRLDRWRACEKSAAMQLAYGLIRDQLQQELREVGRLIAYVYGTPQAPSQGVTP